MPPKGSIAVLKGNIALKERSFKYTRPVRRICHHHTTVGSGLCNSEEDAPQQAIIHSHSPGRHFHSLQRRRKRLWRTGNADDHHDAIVYDLKTPRRKSRIDYRRSFLWSDQRAMCRTRLIETADGGPIATVEDGDLIGNGCEGRKLNGQGSTGCLKQKRKCALAKGVRQAGRNLIIQTVAASLNSSPANAASLMAGARLK